MRLVDLVFPGLPARRFTYRIPDTIAVKPSPGARVVAPFRGQSLIGIVIGFPKRINFPSSKLQDISDVLEETPAFDPHGQELVSWISRYYLCSESEAIRLLLPSGSVKRRNPTVELVALPEEPLRGIRQKQLIEFLKGRGRVRVIEVKRGFPEFDVARVLRGLEFKGIVKLSSTSPPQITRSRKSKSTAYKPEGFPSDVTILKSTPAQARVIEKVAVSLKEGRFHPFLLHGVTGSGKTHVYIELTEKTIDAGKSALILVPEIALTPQLSGRFAERFPENVAVLHSGLSIGARREAWTRASEGEIRVIVGARSAIFTPLPNLGLIVVDEEQDQSYKQAESPAYSARDLALVRGKLASVPVLLSSATPSLESYYNAETGKYSLLELPERIDDRKLPAVEILDMKLELRSGNRSTLSGRLAQLIEETVSRGEQVILLLNRRGFFSTMKCVKCGEAVSCSHCSVAMTIHRSSNSLRCHFCGAVREIPGLCPSCDGETFKLKGKGTERIEKELKQFFPDIRVLRMDLDTTRKRGAHRRILARFAAREADVLVGTQMVAKGHDFPGVTLVGVVSADIGLHVPDFRAGERVFQLLTQAAGRAGRGDMEGRVVIQTYQPSHYSVRAASRHSYSSFYEREKKVRKAARYPPFTRMVHIKLFSVDSETVRSAASRVVKHLAPAAGDRSRIILGPAPFPVQRIKREYIWHLLIKTTDIWKTLERLKEEDWKPEPGIVRTQIVIDPASMF